MKKYRLLIAICLWLAGWIPLALSVPSGSAVDAVLGHVLQLCDEAEARLPMAVHAGETIAARHAAGGAIGIWWANGCLGPELYGRSGNIMHIGTDRIWKEERTAEEKSNDVVLVGMDWHPWPWAQRLVERATGQSAFLIGFGPRKHPAITGLVAACDLFFETGFAENDQVVDLGGGRRAGHLNHVANALNGWIVMAETVSALTRMGHTPVMWKSYGCDDGRSWAGKYFRKQQFHKTIIVPPQPSADLGRAYLDKIRKYITKIKKDEHDAITRAAELIAEEFRQGRRTVVAWAGHMPQAYVGLLEDRDWSLPVQLHLFLNHQRNRFHEIAPDGALVVLLGQQGVNPIGHAFFKEKQSRLICIVGRTPDPGWLPPEDALVAVDLVWELGDACVELEGYPFRVFAPSGILKAAAYAALCAQVELLLSTNLHL